MNYIESYVQDKTKIRLKAFFLLQFMKEIILHRKSSTASNLIYTLQSVRKSFFLVCKTYTRLKIYRFRERVFVFLMEISWSDVALFTWRFGAAFSVYHWKPSDNVRTNFYTIDYVCSCDSPGVCNSILTKKIQVGSDVAEKTPPDTGKEKYQMFSL